MLDDKYVPKIDGLINVKYVGPMIVKPSRDTDSPGHDDYLGVEGYNNTQRRKKDLTRLEVVVIATLISTLVGLFGSFVLFKRVYSNQNCLAPCDGTGIDKDYIEDCNKLGIEPIGVPVCSPKSPSGKSSKSGWNTDSQNKHRSALSAIDENSVNTSDFGSLYSGTVSCKSVALKSVASVHSEQTQVIRNGRSSRRDNHSTSTPSFGDDGDEEVSFNSIP